MSNPPRFLVLGCGSIGQRHIGNLLSLGVTDVLAFDTIEERRSQVRDRFQVETVDTLEEGWNRKPDVALVAAPTSLHVPLALEAAQHDCHLFIEKPLGGSLDGIEELLDIIDQRKLITLVGCNMRFHHGPATIKGLLNEGAIGHIMSAHLDAGQYLPDWHPWEDYRQLYASNASQGGGVILDGVHEIDYARWLFGEVAEVYCQGGKLSSLDIDTEDSVNIIMKLVAGIGISIHMDYIQRTYSRSCKVVGEEGTIFWDMIQGEVRLFSAGETEWRCFPQPEGYDVNQMYLDEMSHFLACLREEEETCLPACEAKRVLKIALAIKDSMKTGDKKALAA
jgi:predicted dehydrogenase